MTLKWLIEDFERDNSFSELADEVKKQGMECRVIRYTADGEQKGTLDAYPVEDEVLFQGSIGFAQDIQRTKRWTPGVWADWESFACATYYAHWDRYLLNRDALFMPLARLKERFREFLQPTHSPYIHVGGAFFVRPDSNAKTFPALVLSGEKDFGTPVLTENTWGGLLYDAPDDTLVLVSPVRRIHKEWRVICAAGEVVTGSRYKTWGQVDYKAELPDDVRALALEICSGSFQPDPMYVLDICDSPERGLSLLEAGAFSVAGLYHCDLEAIVRTASRIATASSRPSLGG